MIVGGFRAQVPADLLDPVINLVGMAFGIRGVAVPIRAGNIAAHAPGVDPKRAEPLDAVTRLRRNEPTCHVI